jgi:hypothetical protein
LCDSSHKPTGSALTTGTVNGNSLDYVTGQTFDAAVTSYTLLPDVEYAIVASCEGTNINNSVYLKRDSLAGYSNGSMVASADSGDSWTVDTTNDLYFAVAEDDFTGTRVSKAMQRVSQEVGGYLSGTTDASGGSSGETLKCGALAEYEDDELINRYVYVRSGSAIGDERIIGDFAQTDGVVTPRRAFTAQVASGHRFEIHPFPPSRIIEKLNWATQRTQYLYRTIKDESTITTEDTYEYDVPSTIIGEPLEIWVEKDGTTDPFYKLMDWVYDPVNHKVLFNYTLTASKTIRFIGKGYMTQVITEADSIDADEPEIQHIYALALAYLYQEKMAQTQGEERKQYERDISFWLAEAERRGRTIRLHLPQPTRKVPGWTFSGK